MIINGTSLIDNPPIENMLTSKVKFHGVSHGLSEVGYDIRIKQLVEFFPPNPIAFLNYAKIMTNDLSLNNRDYQEKLLRAFHGFTVVHDNGKEIIKIGRTALASSVEKFNLPNNLWGELRNKSTHARRFFDATIGTDMEPNWKGHLTIEIIFHDNNYIDIPENTGIAKAVFHELKHSASYDGKYQDQADAPVPALLE